MPVLNSNEQSLIEYMQKSDEHLRKGVSLRLVNVGASSAMERFTRFGYPICTVCGQSVSPLSSDKQREQFTERHEERCGRKVEPVGFYIQQMNL